MIFWFTREGCGKMRSSFFSSLQRISMQPQYCILNANARSNLERQQRLGASLHKAGFVQEESEAFGGG
jgi:hypothetical protein